MWSRRLVGEFLEVVRCLRGGSKEGSVDGVLRFGGLL